MKNCLRFSSLLLLFLALTLGQGCTWNDFSVVTWEKYDEVIPPMPDETAAAWMAQSGGVISAFPWTALLQFGTDVLRFRSKYIGQAITNKTGLKSYSIIRLFGGRRDREVWPEAIKAR